MFYLCRIVSAYCWRPRRSPALRCWRTRCAPRCPATGRTGPVGRQQLQMVIQRDGRQLLVEQALHLRPVFVGRAGDVAAAQAVERLGGEAGDVHPSQLLPWSGTCSLVNRKQGNPVSLPGELEPDQTAARREVPAARWRTAPRWSGSGVWHPPRRRAGSRPGTGPKPAAGARWWSAARHSAGCRSALWGCRWPGAGWPGRRHGPPSRPAPAARPRGPGRRDTRAGPRPAAGDPPAAARQLPGRNRPAATRPAPPGPGSGQRPGAGARRRGCPGGSRRTCCSRRRTAPGGCRS